jgi:hypothetical protein
MNTPNYQEMSLKELRDYMLAHRDSDEIFYAYMDKLYAERSGIRDKVYQWLKNANPHGEIAKISEKYPGFVLKDSAGKLRGIRVQTMMYSFTRYHPLLETIIQDLIAANSRTSMENFLTVFVAKNETDAQQIDRELVEANFDSRAKSIRVVGYIDADGKFQNI